MDYFKGNFLNIEIFLHPQIPDFHRISAKYCPIVTNHTLMESFIQLSDYVYISISKNVPFWTGFAVQVHKCLKQMFKISEQLKKTHFILVTLSLLVTTDKLLLNIM